MVYLVVVHLTVKKWNPAQVVIMWSKNVVHQTVETTVLGIIKPSILTTHVNGVSIAINLGSVQVEKTAVKRMFVDFRIALMIQNLNVKMYRVIVVKIMDLNIVQDKQKMIMLLNVEEVREVILVVRMDVGMISPI